ncbi:HK97 gp10 family phage protein [uncultured Pseudomonas sp.]|uniref:HK97 gp10 family phage protein n=1 Tax=uncultured Pseudomonas sp. TaxID=114707 RepID=UPI00258CF252|nr:HK97 gp10 family phage protein [uncultured Pseudomonas sp.]
MTARYGDKSGDFEAQLEDFRELAMAAIEQTIQDIVIQVGESLINLSPVDTGRFKANWQFTIGAPANSSLIATDKEGDETIAKLIAAVNALEPGQVAYIVNTLIYAVPLEYGHSQQAPLGMVRRTIAEFERIVADAIAANQV